MRHQELSMSSGKERRRCDDLTHAASDHPTSIVAVKAPIDSLGRRHRVQRSPTGKIKRPTRRNLIWFQKLLRHGPLPSSYLHAFTAHFCRNATWARHELADLFHENTVHGGPYLDRPFQQFNTLDARHNDLVHDSTNAARDALVEAGHDVSTHTPANAPWVHRHMVACITASIELATLGRDDIRFIPRDEITSAPLRISVPIDCCGRTEQLDLVPDALFGLEYRTGDGERYRLFALEVDRGTEPGRATRADRKSFLKSLAQYRRCVGEGLYKEHLGVSAPLMVLTVTTSAARIRNMVELVATEASGGRNSFMLFRHVPQFGRVFKPPKPMPELLHGPWERAGYEPFQIDAA